MENEMQMSPEEQEKLLAEDPTPEVPRTYKHSAAFRQKQNRYMRAYRTSKVEEQVRAELKSQPPVFLELFQELFQEPDQPDIEENLEAQLYSALWMAELLNQSEPKESETYSQFFKRIFDVWVGSGYPLLVQTEQDIVLGPTRFMSDTTLPTGSDAVIAKPWPGPFGLLQRLDQLEAQSDAVARSRARRLARPDEHWVWNPAIRFMEPKVVFARLSLREELAKYRLGYRYFPAEFPELRLCPELALMSIRATNEDLRSAANADFQAANEIKGRQQ